MRARRPGEGPTDLDPLAGWSRLPAVLQALLLATAFALSAAVSGGLAPPFGDVFGFWPAAGLGATGLLLAPVRRWALLCLALGAGAAVFHMLRGTAGGPAVGYAAAHTLTVLAGAGATLLLTGGRRPDWGRLSDVWATMTGLGLIGPLVGGVAGAAFAAAHVGADFDRSWLEWAAGEAVGALLVAPLFLAVPPDGRLLVLGARRVEAVLCLLIAALLTGLAQGATDLPVAWLAVLPLLWAAQRLEPTGTAFATCVVGMIGVALTAHGYGQFAHAGRTPDDALVLGEGFLMVAIAFGGSQAAVTAERERAAERLRASRDQLRQAHTMEGIGRLAGAIAHDFNTLLTVIEGYARRGLEQTAAGRDPREALGEVVAAAERGTGLTSRLLTFARARPARRAAVELSAAVEAARPMLTGAAGDHHRVVLDQHADGATVALDNAELEQALLNLVLNARDAMPDGGRIGVSTDWLDLPEGAPPPHAGVPPGRWALLAVSDSGAGMDEEERARALEPFFTTKPDGAGAGLGLAIVYGIVEQAGGRLAIDSLPGRGTTVRLYLPPAGEPRAAQARVVADAAADPTGTETVLLAEDDPSLRLLCSLVLAERGYALLEAPDGLAALEVARRHEGRIDLLVSDIVMPGMGGPELYRALAAERPGLRVLFTSGYPPRDLTPEATLDRTNFLPKPYTPAELARRVREVLDDAAVS